MAESYGEKIRRRFKEKRQQHMLTGGAGDANACLLYTSPSPRDLSTSRMPSSA